MKNEKPENKPLFLYQRWLHKTLKEYVTATRPLKLRGRIVVMPPVQYAAALMQAYFGKASLGWISETMGIPLESLQEWRTELKFLLLVDWSKSVFSESFEEKLSTNDYFMVQYHCISGEFSMLDESLRVLIRGRLYTRLKLLLDRLSSCNRYGTRMEPYDLNVFRRLLLFFLALEHHCPDALQNRIQKKFLPFAREVVWPLLGHEYVVESELESARNKYPLPRIRLLLADQLRETFERMDKGFQLSHPGSRSFPYPLLFI
jgi:hypothetical protein